MIRREIKIILVLIGLFTLSYNANAYVVNWQSGELLNIPTQNRMSTNVAFDTFFVDAFPSVSASHPNGFASASVDFTQSNSGVEIFTNTYVEWIGNMTWSGIWANANANYSGAFSIESEAGSTSPVLVDILISLTGTFDDTSLGLSIDNINYTLDPFAPTTVSLLLDVGQTYDLYGSLYSWVVGATPGGNPMGNLSANGIMDISFILPSEDIPEPVSLLLFGVGLILISTRLKSS